MNPENFNLIKKKDELRIAQYAKLAYFCKYSKV
jgi:hypothetical protein